MSALNPKFNMLLNAALVAVVLTVCLHFYQSTSLEKDKLIEQEDIICLVAVCISEKGAGDQCFEINPSLAVVSVTKDSNEPGGKRLIIEPSLKSCNGD